MCARGFAVVHSEFEAEALALVEHCLDLSADERADYLATTCAGRPELRARIDRLLSVSATGLEHAIIDVVRPLFGKPLPTTIGPYLITGLIGSGGMGIVVRGERDDGIFQQSVAIKLIRPDIVDSRAEERFAAERRILARLSHPSIARIIDGGSHEGQAYLVMEYVDGRPVTTAIEQDGLTAPIILDLFRAVCEAVAHAHRNFVIHADIKPSNVLVTGAGTVKLLDFGVSRLIADIDGDTAEPVPLTRAYAAPERLSGATPMITGDVFSLGMLLREMLTGNDTSDGERPRYSALPVLGGDLAAIIAKATASDPAERYQDVASLAEDVRRHCENYPVRARAHEGWRYEANRFLVRHRKGLAVAGMVALALLGATAVSIRMFVDAERARAEATRRFDDVRKLSHVMLFDIYDDLAKLPGSAGARARIADTARRYLDQLRAVPNAPIDLRLDSAKGYVRLATVQGVGGVSSLGRSADALRSLSHAETLAKSALTERPDDPDALEQLGWISSSRWTLSPDDAESPKRNDTARRYFDRALAADPGRSHARLGRLMVMKNQGYDLTWADRSAEAEAVFRHALDELRRTRFADADRNGARLLESNLLLRLGDVAYARGDLPGSLRYYRSAGAIADEQLAHAQTPEWLARKGEVMWNLSGSLADLPGRLPEALAVADAGIASMRRMLSYGADAAGEKMLFILHGQRALVLSSMGRNAEAAQAAADDITIQRRRLAAEPGDPSRWRDLGVGLLMQADLLWKAGRHSESCSTARATLGVWKHLESRRQLSASDRTHMLPRAEANLRRSCG